MSIRPESRTQRAEVAQRHGGRCICSASGFVRLCSRPTQETANCKVHSVAHTEVSRSRNSEVRAVGQKRSEVREAKDQLRTFSG